MQNFLKSELCVRTYCRGNDLGQNRRNSLPCTETKVVQSKSWLCDGCYLISQKNRHLPPLIILGCWTWRLSVMDSIPASRRISNHYKRILLQQQKFSFFLCFTFLVKHPFLLFYAFLLILNIKYAELHAHPILCISYYIQ